MKTTLTLNTGSFYFLSTVYLIKGVAAEVDLSTLSEGELKGVKAYIVSGNISSSEDITDYHAPVEETAEQKTEEKEVTTKQEVTEEVPVKDKKEVQAEEAVASEAETDKKDYSKMVKKELKAELDKRGIETDLTRNEDLIKLLEEDDAK